MRTYLYCEAGFVEKPQWLPNCWVNVVCPDNDDFEFLTKTLNVPESFLNDIADTDERPRTDTEGNWLLTILRIPMQNGQNESLPFGTVPIGIITNNEIIVSVCYHNTDLLPDFIEHTRRKGIEVRNKLDLILRLIYSSAVWFLKYLKQINLDISAAEKELERSIRNEDLLRLMRLQKTLVYFNTSIRGNEVMIGKLQSIFQDTDFLDKELVEDVIIELKQAFNTVNIYSDILTGTMDAFASIISNNVNAIMKRMTSLSITLMIRIKRMMMALCIFVCTFTLVACSGQQTNEPLTLGVNAIITEIDKENKIITTKDSEEKGVLGNDCLIDCSKIPMIYCNYDTQNVVAITLYDLQVGDEIILTIRNSEIENLQKEDDNKTKIAVEQLQLGTQRIK